MVGGRIVEHAGASNGTILWLACCKQNLSGANQHQGSCGNSSVILAEGQSPGVGEWVVELAGITREMVSVGQDVTICKQCGTAARAGPRHGRRQRPSACGRIVELGIA